MHNKSVPSEASPPPDVDELRSIGAIVSLLPRFSGEYLSVLAEELERDLEPDRSPPFPRLRRAPGLEHPG
jgi:hypothetical protein